MKALQAHNWICKTCALQTATPITKPPPHQCRICVDERSFVALDGQQWTHPQEIAQNHKVKVLEHEPGLLGIGLDPPLGIGNRAMVVKTEAGNVLWDCLPFLNEEIMDILNSAGGIKAFAISHPHFYGAMVDYAEALALPCQVSIKDKEWVYRDSPRIKFLEGDKWSILDGIDMIRVGGHFAGSSILHWTSTADGKGAILTGDTPQYTPKLDTVGFMYSYPNYIPLPAEQVARIRDILEPLKFDRMYASWFGKDLKEDAHHAVQFSANRYIDLVTGKASRAYW